MPRGSPGPCRGEQEDSNQDVPGAESQDEIAASYAVNIPISMGRAAGNAALTYSVWRESRLAGNPFEAAAVAWFIDRMHLRNQPVTRLGDGLDVARSVWIVLGLAP